MKINFIHQSRARLCGIYKSVFHFALITVVRVMTKSIARTRSLDGQNVGKFTSSLLSEVGVEV